MEAALPDPSHGCCSSWTAPAPPASGPVSSPARDHRGPGADRLPASRPPCRWRRWSTCSRVAAAEPVWRPVGDPAAPSTEPLPGLGNARRDPADPRVAAADHRATGPAIAGHSGGQPVEPCSAGQWPRPQVRWSGRPFTAAAAGRCGAWWPSTVLGDMLQSDVNAAALAGLTGIWLDRGIDFVTGGPSPTADETVPRIEQPTDLPNRLSPTDA